MLHITKKDYVTKLAIAEICKLIRAGDFEGAEKYVLTKQYATDKIGLAVMETGDVTTYQWFAATRLEADRKSLIVKAVLAGNVKFLAVLLHTSGVSNWTTAAIAAIIVGNQEVLDLVLERGPAPYLPRDITKTHMVVTGDGILGEPDAELAAEFSGRCAWPITVANPPRGYFPGDAARKISKYVAHKQAQAK
jgi:hypothetical protein